MPEIATAERAFVWLNGLGTFGKTRQFETEGLGRLVAEHPGIIAVHAEINYEEERFPTIMSRVAGLIEESLEEAPGVTVGAFSAGVSTGLVAGEEVKKNNPAADINYFFVAGRVVSDGLKINDYIKTHPRLTNKRGYDNYRIALHLAETEILPNMDPNDIRARIHLARAERDERVPERCSQLLDIEPEIIKANTHMMANKMAARKLGELLKNAQLL